MTLMAKTALRAASFSEWDVWSPDKRLRVSLSLCAGGVYLERCHQLGSNGRIVQGLMCHRGSRVPLLVRRRRRTV